MEDSIFPCSIWLLKTRLSKSDLCSSGLSYFLMVHCALRKITSFDENRRQQQAMSKRPSVGVGVIVMKGDQVLLILSREHW